MKLVLNFHRLKKLHTVAHVFLMCWWAGSGSFKHFKRKLIQHRAFNNCHCPRENIAFIRKPPSPMLTPCTHTMLHATLNNTKKVYRTTNHVTASASSWQSFLRIFTRSWNTNKLLMNNILFLKALALDVTLERISYGKSWGFSCRPKPESPDNPCNIDFLQVLMRPMYNWYIFSFFCLRKTKNKLSVTTKCYANAHIV